MKRLIVVGSALVLVGLICNQWTVAYYCAWYGVSLSFPEKLAIWGFDLFTVGFGAVILLFRKNKAGFNILLLMLAIFVSLVAAETYLRLFNPQIGGKSEHSSLFQYNSTTGWQFAPGKAAVNAMPGEFNRKIVINSAGMRGREYALAKPGGKKRIVVLGDSLTSGLEVENKDVFTAVMGNSFLSDTEVLNFGVNGFGPTQEFLLLKEKCIKYNPDLVIMVIYIGNDFDDAVGLLDWNGGYQRPRTVLRQGGIVHIENIPVPRPSTRHPLLFLDNVFYFFRPHLLELIRQRFYGKDDIRFMPPEIRLCKKAYSEETKRSYETTAAIIRMTDSLCRTHDIKFLVVIAPTIVQVYAEEYWEKIKRSYHIKDDEYDIYLPNKELGRMCASRDIPVLDLLPSLRSCKALGEETYYRKNRHWNERGHYTAAKEIADYLKRNWI